MPTASRHASSRPRTSPVKTALTIVGVALLLAVIGAGVFIYFNGWSTLFGEQAAPVHEENFQKPAEPAKFYPDGSADDNLPYFTELLEKYAKGDGTIAGQPVVDAVVDGGFDVSAMQVSFDRTKTDLVADNIFVSVRIERDCLVGQLTTTDRQAFAIVAPALGPEHDICLIGKTRPIDW